ncbi:MAG: tetratricopeptide repeat protein [Endomicrobium sp.]|jgi:tetratricopeptide (TPR) repeat protein|nr:tetratricopeptide repeat protein [Endomicrobium sp.]
MKKYFIAFSFVFFAAAAYAQNAYESQLKNAQTDFQNGNYAKAASVYESLITVEKINNPYIYYNLSNAYYRAGDTGKAALNIRKAYRLAPRDKNIRANLAFIDKAAGEPESQSLFSGNFLSLNELSAAAAVFIIAFLSLFSIFFISGKKFFKKAAYGALIVLMPLILASYFKINSEIINKEAAVLKVSVVRSGPAVSSPELFSVPAGRKAIILASNGTWSEIKIKSGSEDLTGWIETDHLGAFN